MAIREPLPHAEEWAARLDLRRRGGEYVGPCPVCGGDDRFHVRTGQGGAALVGCRSCIDGEPKHVGAQRFGAVLRAAFPERFHVEHATKHQGSRSPVISDPAAHAKGDGGSTADCGSPDARETLARRLWDLAALADDSPGRRYLARRWAWPPLGIEGAPDLPASVRWLTHEAAPERDSAARWYGLPSRASGALVFAWRRPGAGDDAAVGAVSFEALTAAGEWLPKRWRRTHGVRKGTVFTVSVDAIRPVLAIVEGEVDALAVARASRERISSFRDIGEVRAVGSAGLFVAEAAADVHGRDVLFLPDGPNRKGKAIAAAKAAKAAAVLRAAGRVVRVEIRTDGGDVADDVREAVIEREAIQHDR